MPSGPKKRKAAKKKQVNASSNSSSTSHSHHGESDGGELNSPVAQDQHNNQLPFTEVENREDGVTQNKNNEGIDKEEEVKNIEIDNWSKSMQLHDSKSSSCSHSSDDESHAIEKKVVELVQPVETLPEKIVQEIEVPGVGTSSVRHHFKTVDSLLEDINNDSKIEEKTDLVVEETPPVPALEKSSFLEKKFVVNGSTSKDTCSTSSVGIESVLVNNGASNSKVTVAVSIHNGADDVNEPETLQYSDKQPLVASTPQAVQTTSWKGCCGILELFAKPE
uniref:uncharacterized protein LOC122582032 n=1 Tax=Erigeron canadensis TaxID=72917 RepID=UPI001CB89820|nr:uncharacterized protein LOC122582032 [Erigeron canadensis]